jgi:tetratricopeptide (TPR) repeat protein|tara:strand:+ start:372 stop:770 length:399 start_codon:yes stop_codon:yes gene_type:complete
MSCSSSSEEQNSTVSSTVEIALQIDKLVAEDKYTEALELLAGQPNGPEILTLKEMTHLNYGLYLEYRDSNVTNMRDKMNNALREYVKVLRINPDNEKAISEIEQILGIYATFRNRAPAEDVVADLEEFGFTL